MFKKGHKHSENWYRVMISKEYREKQRKATLARGDKPPIAWGNKVNLGRTHSLETKQKMSESQKKRVLTGKHNNYKGGITPINIRVRASIEMNLWRKAIFVRDNWTCRICGKVGCKLHPHHIVNFASIINEIRYAYKDGLVTYDRAIKYDFLWDSDNGITLCKECHKKTDTFLKVNTYQITGA